MCSTASVLRIAAIKLLIPAGFRSKGMSSRAKRHVTTCLARGDCFYGLGRTVLGSATYRF
jgi:iron complex outermembrane receptor protein